MVMSAHQQAARQLGAGGGVHRGMPIAPLVRRDSSVVRVVRATVGRRTRVLSRGGQTSGGERFLLKNAEHGAGTPRAEGGRAAAARVGSAAQGERQVMNIVERSKLVLLHVGASPILYLMLALSVASIAVMLERAIFYARVRGDLQTLASQLATLLGAGDVAGARALVAESRSIEASIVAAGLSRLPHGAQAVEEAMAGASAVQRMRLERRLGFLGTLGSNAPFVGLLGTVIGIVQAFDQLQAAGTAGAGAGANAMNGVMGAIAEALVATAIGLLVAIPAVAAFNAFQRRIKGVLGNAEALRHIVLSHVKSVPSSSSGSSGHGVGQEDSHVVRFEQLSASAH
jgi:biopolymer transport protein ExbB